jgi:hypothetical protein
MDEETLGADLLRGAPQIAAFIGAPVKDVYYQLSTGQLPAGKIGSNWIASKKAIRSFYEKITNPPPRPQKESVADGLEPRRGRGRPRKVASF